MSNEFGMWIWPVTLADEGVAPLFRMRELGLNAGLKIYADVSPGGVSGIAQAEAEAGADGIWFFSYHLANAEVLEAVGRFIPGAK